MAGREKRAPTPMPGPVRRSRAPTPVGLRSRATTPVPNRSRAATPVPGKRTLKTVETQTPSISRRPSISLQPPAKFSTIIQKRLSSPYAMRSESPVRTLRNGKQQKIKDSGLLLDGIPIVKRSRSLMSIESDTSSIVSSTTFNDSVDSFFNFNLPEIPLDRNQPDGTMTPRRGRPSRLSESSSIASSPLVTPKHKKLDLPSPIPLKVPPVKKEKKDVPQTKEVTPPEGKKKRGRPANSPGTPTPVKKPKKLQKTEVNIELAEDVEMAEKTGIKRRKVVATATVKTSKVVAIKGNKKLLKNGTLKMKKEIVITKKPTGRPLLKKNLLKRNIMRVTAGNINKRIPKKTKGLLGKQKNKRLIGKKLAMKVQLPITKRKKQPIEKKTVKREDPPAETPSVKVKNEGTSSEKTTNSLPATQEPEESLVAPEPLPKTEENKKEESKNSSDDVAKPLEISIKEKSAKLSVKEKVSIKDKAKLSMRKVKKPVKKVKTETTLSNDAQTLKTLTEASLILQRLAESDENDKETNNENEESQKTPTPMSPNILNNLPVNHEVNGVCTGTETQQDASHVSPLDSLANKLRRKLSQSPKLNSNDPARLGKSNAVSVTSPIMKPLPIINSLSAAAKQTSSFLKNADEIELPGRKETQWKVNKKLIYHKIKPNKQAALAASKLNASLKGTMSCLFEKSTTSPVTSTNKATSTVTKILNKSSETITKPSVNITPETKTTSTSMSNGDIDDSEKTHQLDSNENNLDEKLNQDKETTTSVEPEMTTPEKLPAENEIVQPESSKITPIPDEKDKPIIDNHSDIVVKKSSISKNKSEKTETQEEKKKSLEISLPVEEPTVDSIPTPPEISPETAVTAEVVTPPPVELEIPTQKSKEPEKESSGPVLPDVPLSVIASRGQQLFPYDEEDLVAKVSILGALGLQSNQALSEQAKAPKVPKLRLVCRPTLKKHRRSTNHDASTSGSYKEKTYAVCREGDSFTDWEKPSPSKGSRDMDIDTCTPSLIWSPRMPISNGKVLETFAEPTTSEPGVGVGDGLGGDTTEGGEKAQSLVIPEKSSSFGIHPARLCEDVCCYCHNKFGLYDTPLHVAQLKGDEKQQSVLARETFLTLESCLCDACFRHLDRPGAPKPHKPPVSKQKPQPNQICCFKDCSMPADHTMMRKWKRRVRTLMREEFQDSKTTNWLCEGHYLELAKIGSCGICQRRLHSQQMYKLEGRAVTPLNKILRRDYVPITLDDTMSLCKKCRFYTSLRLRSEDYMKLNTNNRAFLREHRNWVLKALSVDITSVPEVFVEQEKPKKQPKKKVTTSEVEPTTSSPAAVASTSTSTNNSTHSSGPLKPQKIRFKFPPSRKMPTNARMSTGHRIPSEIQITPTGGKVQNQFKLGTGSGIKLPSQTRITLQPRPIAPAPPKALSPDVRISPVLSRLADKGRATSNALSNKVSLSKYRSTSSTATSSQPPEVTIVPLTSRPSGSQYVRSPPPATVTQRDLPSNSEVAMSAKFDFQPTEDTSSWQKVNATFQFDQKTRQMWQNLHAPYGNYTSFLRHLVMLENYWRNGDLILSPTATVRSRQYLKSVHNRIQAYEGVPSDLGSVPLISDVRSLATSEVGNWSMDSPSTSM